MATAIVPARIDATPGREKEHPQIALRGSSGPISPNNIVPREAGAKPLDREQTTIGTTLSAPYDALEKQRRNDGFRKLLSAMAQRYCDVVSLTIKKSNTKETSQKSKSDMVSRYRSIIETVRSADTLLSSIRGSIKYSSGNCSEMAILAATLVNLEGKYGLSKFRVASFIRGTVYRSQAPSDHEICVVECRIDGKKEKYVIDPWARISLPYKEYVGYLNEHADRIHTHKDAVFFINDAATDIILSEDFQTDMKATLVKFGLLS